MEFSKEQITETLWDFVDKGLLKATKIKGEWYFQETKKAKKLRGTTPSK